MTTTQTFDLSTLNDETFEKQFLSTAEAALDTMQKAFASAVTDAPLTREALNAKVTDHEVGDLIAVWEMEKGRRNYWSGNSEVGNPVSAFAVHYKVRLYLVIEKTARSIIVQRKGAPQYSDFNLLALATVNPSVYANERFGESQYRHTVNLGNASDLVAKVIETNTFARHQRLVAAKAKFVAEVDRRREVAQAAAKAQEAPFATLAKKVNNAVGADVVRSYSDGIAWAYDVKNLYPATRNGLITHALAGNRAAMGDTKEVRDALTGLGVTF
jgi:hypothetical protein